MEPLVDEQSNILKMMAAVILVPACKRGRLNIYRSLPENNSREKRFRNQI